MKKFVLTDPGAILDHVYDLELPSRAWISAITEQLNPMMTGGNGTLGSILKMNEQLQVPVLSPHEADAEVPAFHQFLKMTEQLFPSSHDSQHLGQLFAASGMGTLSVDRQGAGARKVFLDEFRRHGIIDAAGLIVPHLSSRTFIFFTARQKETTEVPTRAKRRWVDLQNHIAAVYGLREKLENEQFQETDAVWFDTSGDCVERGPTYDPEIRERLRQAVLKRERSRSGHTASRRIDLADYWDAVLSGQWVILDRFDTDGRRYVIALPVSEMGDKIRGLSQREREVLDLMADGHANKSIAYELGISTTAISSHLNNIYRKLGIDGRTDIVRLAQRVRSTDPHRSRLAS